MSALLSRLIRMCEKYSRSVGTRLTTAKYRHIGQTKVASSAVIEVNARIDMDFRNKRDVVFAIGANSKIKSYAYVAPRSGFITIGKGCSINRNCVLLGYGGITIGNNVRIAANTSIIAFNHNFADADTPIIEQGNSWKGVTIEDDVWIGTGVRILDGVTLGRGAVIGAGSVVTKSVPPFSVAVGSPARVIKTRQ